VTVDWQSLLSPAAYRQMQVARVKTRASKRKKGRFDKYRLDPAAYIRQELGWEPWRGSEEKPGQMEVIDAYTLAIRQQLEKNAYEQGERNLDELTVWRPGQLIQNWIRVESGNLVGKTKLASGLFSQFFDCFPSIIYTFAPSAEQINDLLWKEIRNDRGGERNLPGRVLEIPRLKESADHFAVGRATDNSNDSGIERLHGQHHPYLMFILDEAEGVADFVYEALEGMDTGVVVIVLLLANPRTRRSRFHKLAALPYVRSFRISTLDHPNVVSGRQVIPGAATREWVERRADNAEYCERVNTHEEEEFTFELTWRPGIIYRPKPLFFWRVLGIAPANIVDDVFCSVGRYEAAKGRRHGGEFPTIARIGVDAARFGSDFGTVYVRHNGRVWREAVLSKRRTGAYFRAIKAAALRLDKLGVTDLVVRVDGSGGFGGGVVDLLLADVDLRQAFDFFEVEEVHFQAVPYDIEAFTDLITEMYYHAAEALRTLALDDPPEALEADLCERPFSWVKSRGYDVKKLRPKGEFKKKVGRSPDDGDGLALCVAPDYLFEPRQQELVRQVYDPVRIGGWRRR
jgi:hypothetical protein